MFGCSVLIKHSWIFQNKTLVLFFKGLPTLLYLGLIYDILSQQQSFGKYHILLADLPALFFSIMAVINYHFHRKMQFISKEDIKNV
jgi:hypothetical protein